MNFVLKNDLHFAINFFPTVYKSMCDSVPKCFKENVSIFFPPFYT